jgi:hypothetical protein
MDFHIICIARPACGKLQQLSLVRLLAVYLARLVQVVTPDVATLAKCISRWCAAILPLSGKIDGSFGLFGTVVTARHVPNYLAIGALT